MHKPELTSIFLHYTITHHTHTHTHTQLFKEADYQKEGSLDTRALTIAIAGRFPKREHTPEWRLLTALLLGLPELVLTTDAEVGGDTGRGESRRGGLGQGTCVPAPGRAPGQVAFAFLRYPALTNIPLAPSHAHILTTATA